MIYAWRHPTSVDRSVMIGVNPPGDFLWYAKTTDAQIRRYSRLCAKDAVCSNTTTNSPQRCTRRRSPTTGGSCRSRRATFDRHVLRLVQRDVGGRGPIAAPKTIDAWLSAAKGDASGFWLQSLMSPLVFRSAQVQGERAAFGRIDVASLGGTSRATGPQLDPRRPRDRVHLGRGRLLNAWPADPDDGQYNAVQTSQVPTLLIGGQRRLRDAGPERDPRAPTTPAERPPGRSARSRPRGRLLGLRADGSSHLMNAYFESGKVDPSQFTRHAINFTPSVAQTGLAKIVLAVMLAFGTLAALSLVLLPLRVRRPGGFGRKSAGTDPVAGHGRRRPRRLVHRCPDRPDRHADRSARQRSPRRSLGRPAGRPRDLLGVGSPRLAVRDEDDRSRGRSSGALVGGWLGYHATPGLFAVLTTIAGAAVGGNLTLLVLDIVRSPVAAEAAAPARTSLTPA